MQRTPVVDESDVERVICRDFGDSNRARILERISAVEVRERSRVVLACVKASNGNFERLMYLLDDAAGYWREIISEAEYPLATRRWGKMRGMAEEEKQAIYDKDWMQYEHWLNATWLVGEVRASGAGPVYGRPLA